MTLLLALSLVLDPAPLAQTTSAAPAAAVEAPHYPKLRTWAWIPAAGYGLAAFGAGVAASVVGFLDGGQGDHPNIPRANTALAVGAAIGLVPGLLLGSESRREENEKGRTSVVILDVIGTVALVFGYATSHYRLTP